MGERAGSDGLRDRPGWHDAHLLDGRQYLLEIRAASRSASLAHRGLRRASRSDAADRHERDHSPDNETLASGVLLTFGLSNLHLAVGNQSIGAEIGGTSLTLAVLALSDTSSDFSASGSA